jgi:hypothetical protein
MIKKRRVNGILFLLVIVLLSTTAIYAAQSKILCKEAGDSCKTGVCAEASYGIDCKIYECKHLSQGGTPLYGTFDCNSGIMLP